MFKDTKIGKTHHYEDACLRCEHCGGHYPDKYELHQHHIEIMEHENNIQKTNI